MGGHNFPSCSWRAQPSGELSPRQPGAREQPIDPPRVTCAQPPGLVDMCMHMSAGIFELTGNGTISIQRNCSMRRRAGLRMPGLRPVEPSVMPCTKWVAIGCGAGGHGRVPAVSHRRCRQHRKDRARSAPHARGAARCRSRGISWLTNRSTHSGKLLASSSISSQGSIAGGRDHGIAPV